MKKWDLDFPDKRIISELTIKCGISSLAAAVLASRGYSSPESVMSSLQVSELSDPFLMKDMDIAADIINEAIDNGDKICVYGDYDCDGIMATVMLYSYLQETGADVAYYIPERKDGYGLNKDAVQAIANEDTKLIITVDNGISAIDEAEFIYSCGMRLIVTDHHQTGDVLPRAEAIVDPHRRDCFSPFKFLCGAGVVLKLIAALDGGDYTMALEQFGDLAAVATVADIVSLTGENRFIVSYGMNLIENTDRPSLEAMKNVCGLENKKIDSTSIGFGIAPRINAAGRFGSPKAAAELFLCEDPEEAFELAEELDHLNDKRKNAEAEIIHEINSMIDADPTILHERVIFICGKNWHHGVIGIVAAKIMERCGKPCFIASEENNEIRGSARSVNGFSIFDSLKYCSGALVKFGGHPGAGGFTIKTGMISEFNRLLKEFSLEYYKDMPDVIIKPDAAVSPIELQPECVKGISVLEPFGCENEKPLFYIKNAFVDSIVPIKNGLHSKLRLKFGTAYLNAFIFRVSPEELTIARGDYCDFAVSLDIYSSKGSDYVSTIIREYSKNFSETADICADGKLFEAFMRDEELAMAEYRKIFPMRNEVAAIYKRIPDEGISFESLFAKMKHDVVNYGKFSVAVEAMRQLSLISYTPSDQKIIRLKVNNKVDLMSAPVLLRIKNKIGSAHII